MCFCSSSASFSKSSNMLFTIDVLKTRRKLLIYLIVGETFLSLMSNRSLFYLECSLKVITWQLFDKQQKLIIRLMLQKIRQISLSSDSHVFCVILQKLYMVIYAFLQKQTFEKRNRVIIKRKERWCGDSWVQWFNRAAYQRSASDNQEPKAMLLSYFNFLNYKKKTNLEDRYNI